MSIAWLKAPSASTTPQFAPGNVLELPPWTDTRERGTYSEPDEISGMGSGVKDLGSEPPPRNTCFNCESGDVRYVLYARCTVHSGTGTSAVHERVELFCEQCRHFTAYVSTIPSP